MIDVNLIYSTLDSAFASQNVLDTIMEFERTLDTLDIYVYKNWIKGEIVEGPTLNRYWVTVTLMYPYKLMPDPAGAERLIDHGCKVSYGKDTLKYVAKIKDSEDQGKTINGFPRAKLLEAPVWLVKVEMPRHFVDEIQTNKLETESGTVDMEDVTDAYDDNLNDQEASKGNAVDEQ